MQIIYGIIIVLLLTANLSEIKSWNISNSDGTNIMKANLRYFPEMWVPPFALRSRKVIRRPKLKAMRKIARYHHPNGAYFKPIKPFKTISPVSKRISNK